MSSPRPNVGGGDQIKRQGHTTDGRHGSDPKKRGARPPVRDLTPRSK